MLTSVYIQLGRKHGLWTSGVLFTFWTILLFCDVLCLVSKCVQIVNEVGQYFVLSCYEMACNFMYAIFYLVICGSERAPLAKLSEQIDSFFIGYMVSEAPDNNRSGS